MGRTVEELLLGSPAFLPMSEYELREWYALLKLEEAEAEEQAARLKK